MNNYGRDDDCAANERPTRGPFADKKKNPDWVQDRLDVANDSRIKRSHSSRHSQGEQQVSKSNLHDAQISHASKVCRAYPALHRTEERRRANQNRDQISVDRRGGAIDLPRFRMTQQQKKKRKANS